MGTATTETYKYSHTPSRTDAVPIYAKIILYGAQCGGQISIEAAQARKAACRGRHIGCYQRARRLIDFGIVEDRIVGERLCRFDQQGRAEAVSMLRLEIRSDLILYYPVTAGQSAAHPQHDLLCDGRIEGSGRLLPIIIAITHLNGAFPLVTWATGNEQDSSTVAVAAKQRSLGTGQSLNRWQIPDLVVDSVDRKSTRLNSSH